MAEIVKRFEVSEQTLRSWRNHHGGMKGGAMKLLKDLERENAQLKRLVTEQAIDLSMLMD